MIPTLIGITFLVFMLVALSPGGVGAALEMAGGGAPEATQRALQEAYLEDRYGLDDPVILQYVRWLHRISPIKFGQRDQITPRGDVMRPPKRVDPPPLWQWFVDELPATEPVTFAFEAAMSDDERARVYRRAASDYSRIRAQFIAERTLFRQRITDWVQAVEIHGAVRRATEVNWRIVERHGKDESVEQWAAVEEQGRKMLEHYIAAAQEREQLAAVFRAQPFRQAGLAIIPGVLSVATPDLGMSFSRGRPVSELILAALPITLLLNFIAFPIIYLIAIPSGMLAACNRGTWIDVTQSIIVIGLWSIPVVWAGVMMLMLFAGWLGWFPVSGVWNSDIERFPFLPKWGEGGFERGVLLDVLWHVTLPVICLVYTGFAILSKQTRAAMLDNFNQDYVRTAKAKGVSRKDIIFKHVFRNSLLPLITMFVLIFPAMLSGAVVVEKIFTIPGMGLLVIDAITLRDREIILAVATIIAGVNILALLFADILYALADPRISYK